MVEFWRPIPEALRLAVALAIVLWAPGGLLVTLIGRRERGWLAVGMALSLSIAFWPLFMLFCRWSGAQLNAGRLAVAAGILVLLAVTSSLRRGIELSLRPPGGAASWTMLVIVTASLGLRAWHIRGVVLPPWVDGYHHSLIVELFLEQGGVPNHWRPYLPVERFYYHFGFHALAAAVAWLANVPSAQATLWLGQTLNALVPLALLPLLRRSTDWAVAAVAATVVPAALYYFPAYYGAWGRYTQLAGLCLLPTAWLLVGELALGRVENVGRRSRAMSTVGQVAASAVAMAGLFLVHVRVFAFFVAGLPVLLVAMLRHRTDASRWLSLWLAFLLAFLFVVPWLAHALLPAAAARASISSRWYEAPAGASHVPSWLFTIGLNRPLLAIGALGLALGLTARRSAAWATLATLLVAVAMVSGHMLGLPRTTFLSPFSLAISAFLPVAVGIAIGLDSLLGWLHGRGDQVGYRAQKLIALAASVLALLGFRLLGQVITPATILVQAGDLRAAEWIRRNTPKDACFLVTTGLWQLGTYRGLDGGYWLPLLARRPVTIPASYYNHGRPEYALAVRQVAELAARGDKLRPTEIVRLLRISGAQYVYVGPASSGLSDAFSAQQLATVPGLSKVYEREGVTIFRAKIGPPPTGNTPARWLCQPLG